LYLGTVFHELMIKNLSLQRGLYQTVHLVLIHVVLMSIIFEQYKQLTKFSAFQ
jgi:hypothetical protein